MKKLTKIFECVKQGKQQELHVSCSVKSKKRIDELGYDDFEINLYINGNHIGEVSRLLDKAGAFNAIIDDIDWHEVYQEQVIEQTEIVDE